MINVNMLPCIVYLVLRIFGYMLFLDRDPLRAFLGILFVPRGEAARLEAVCGSSSPSHLQLEFKDQLRGSSLRVSFTLIYLSAALYCEIVL